MKSKLKIEFTSEIVKTKTKKVKRKTFNLSHNLNIPEKGILELLLSTVEFLLNPAVQEFAVMVITYLMNRSFYYYFNNRFFVFRENDIRWN